MIIFAKNKLMRTSIQCIRDNKGVKTSVIVPYDKWEKLNIDFQKLQNKLKVFLSIQEGMEEIGRVAVPDSKHGFGALENSLDVSFTDRLVRIQWNITQVFGD